VHGAVAVRGPDDGLVHFGVPYREGEGVVVDAVEAAGESAVWGAQDVGLVLVDGERGS